jgi:hypothetical protein
MTYKNIDRICPTCSQKVKGIYIIDHKTEQIYHPQCMPAEREKPN